jgi:four helix bundle protein
VKGIMSQQTPPFRRTTNHRSLPRGRAKLLAFELAAELAGTTAQLELPRGLSHLRDHLVRAADNTALRLSEASGRTMGNRYQHLEAAYAENQEVQSDLLLLSARGVELPPGILQQADRVGGLIYGLLRAEARGQELGGP